MTNIRYGPPKPTAPFEHTIHVRLTKKQLEAIETMANQYETPPSTLVRHFVMQAVDQLSESSKATDPETPHGE